MSRRENIYHERLIEEVKRRDWTDEDIAHFTHMIGHSALMYDQGVLAVLEFQAATDGRIAAERTEAEEDFDRVFVPDDYFEPELPLPIIERPDGAQFSEYLNTRFTRPA